jgi:hypothetical protein
MPGYGAGKLRGEGSHVALHGPSTPYTLDDEIG